MNTSKYRPRKCSFVDVKHRHCKRKGTVYLNRALALGLPEARGGIA